MPSASRPRQGRKVIGLFTDWLKDSYQNGIVTAIAHACAEHDANCLCFAGGHLENNASAWSRRNILFEFAGPHLVDALIVMGGNVGTLIGPTRLKQYLERTEIPKIISIAYRLDGTPSVLVDNSIGLRRAIEHVIDEHGRKRIAFIRGPVENQEAEERYAVYRKVLWERGFELELKLTAVGDFLRPSGRSAMSAILASNLPFDAVVAANDLMALGAMEVLDERGIRIPEAVSMVGFDDGDEARIALPQLSTVRQPLHLVGREAVRLALAAINGDSVPNEVTIPTEVVIRRSCGCGAMVWDEERAVAISLVPSAPQEYIEHLFVAAFSKLASNGIVVAASVPIELFALLCEELTTGAKGRFAGNFADLIRTTASENQTPWNALTREILDLIGTWTTHDVTRRARFEVVAAQVNHAVGDVAELKQGMLRMRQLALTLNLSDISKALTGVASFPDIVTALNTHIPTLKIPSCFLSLYVERSAAQPLAKLSWAYDSLDPTVATRVGTEYSCRNLLPEGLLFGNERKTVLLEPLFFEEEQLGILAVSMGPEEGVVYEALRDQVSGAIRAVKLVERLVEEVKRRQLLEKEQAEKEMRIAADIQTMILPPNQSIPGFTVSASMEPATNVGGDYYDIHPTANGCWLGIGDVVGHGLRSGLIMLMVQSAISSLVRSGDGLTPKDVLCATNALIYDNVRMRLRQDEHMTLCVLRAYADGRVEFAGAHEELLIYRARTRHCEQIVTDGIWAGIVPDVSRETTNRKLLLERGDVLVLYTDGVTEARDIRGRMFGLTGLISVIERVGSEHPERIRKAISDEVRAHMASQEDDMALLVARYNGK